MIKVNWTYDNRDSVTVTGAESASEAWDAAEYFLADVSEKDETAEYSTGLSGPEGIEEYEGREYVFSVKCYEKSPQ